jgi:hypothetical protein
MFEIRELTGQDYRNTYATKQAESIPSAKAVIAHASDAREPILATA